MEQTIKALLLLLTMLFHSTGAFAPMTSHSAMRHYTAHDAIVSVDGEKALDKTVEEAGSSLVVVNYATTWCGPCKVIASEFEEMSTKYPDNVFVKVFGDSSKSASKLMKREKVRSVPSFHYFKNGKKVDVVNGAARDLIEEKITKYM